MLMLSLLIEGNRKLVVLEIDVKLVSSTGAEFIIDIEPVQGCELVPTFPSSRSQRGDGGITSGENGECVAFVGWEW
jgi:hypothetical protein